MHRSQSGPLACLLPVIVIQFNIKPLLYFCHKMALLSCSVSLQPITQVLTALNMYIFICWFLTAGLQPPQSEVFSSWITFFKTFFSHLLINWQLFSFSSSWNTKNNTVRLIIFLLFWWYMIINKAVWIGQYIQGKTVAFQNIVSLYIFCILYNKMEEFVKTLFCKLNINGTVEHTGVGSLFLSLWKDFMKDFITAVWWPLVCSSETNWPQNPITWKQIYYCL